MRRDARFWRNVVLITLVHVAALIALLRWAGASKVESAREITWLNADQDASLSIDSPKPEETPAPVEEKLAPPEENQSLPAPTKSDIELPTATPSPSPPVNATPDPSPRASPKPSPKKKTSPKPSATPEKKKSKAQATPAKEKQTSKRLAAKKGDTKKSEKKETKSGNAAGGGTQVNTSSANAGWYGNMLHDRFYREWAQPTTVVASGAKLSALARIRIEKDGRISNFKIVRPSGNLVVDESVVAVGKKVTRVDALPAGIGNGGHYDVNINFALNSK
jgi:TonB family protein